MGWRDKKATPAPAAGAAAVVVEGRDISRAEIRLRCVECAMTMRVSGAGVEAVIANAEKFFAWVVEETAEAK